VSWLLRGVVVRGVLRAGSGRRRLGRADTNRVAAGHARAGSTGSTIRSLCRQVKPRSPSPLLWRQTSAVTDLAVNSVGIHVSCLGPGSDGVTDPQRALGLMPSRLADKAAGNGLKDS
jgi:hypothetical protein